MKKIFTILGMITCMVGLTACGSSSKETVVYPITEEQAIESGELTVDSMAQVISQGMEDQYTYDDVLYSGILGFKSALLGDIGNYLDTDGGTVEFNEKEIIIKINVLGSDHNAVVEIVVDGESYAYTSIATNVTYSLGEKMEKAALNTLLGMGTVFIILILISLIISAFGLIPKLLESKKTKPEEGQKEEADKVVSQIVQNEELSDDLELVAVISAAIAAYEGSGSTDGFVVRSIRKAHR